MQKFVFRLQSVLNLKTQMEDNAKNNLANASRILEAERQSLDGLLNEKEFYFSTLNSEAVEGISVYRLRNYNSYLTLLKDRIIEQKEVVNNAQIDVDINREQLVKAVQERKILEKLKEKKYEEFLKDEGRSEQLIIDELNSFKFKENSGEQDARE